jgi:hypothetical protein
MIKAVWGCSWLDQAMAFHTLEADSSCLKPASGIPAAMAMAVGVSQASFETVGRWLDPKGVEHLAAHHGLPVLPG